jgi:hypothetical protein
LCIRNEPIGRIQLKIRTHDAKVWMIRGIQIVVFAIVACAFLPLFRECRAGIIEDDIPYVNYTGAAYRINAVGLQNRQGPIFV